jgi:hypothetical protein
MMAIILILLAMLTYSRLTERAVGPLGYDGLQGQAESYLADIRKRALEVFLAAQGANGVIAVIESMQVGPVVVEGKPGMLLEPVRETVEELAEMMTVSVVTLEALELLREMGIKISFRALIPVGLIFLTASLWFRAIRPLGKGLIVGGLMLSIGLPMTIWAEKAIADSLLEDQYSAAYQNVSQIQSGLGSEALSSDASPSAEQPSFFTRAHNWLTATFGSVPDTATATRLSHWLNDKVESALKLMTIFLMEVFLLPSLLGYAIYRALRSMMVRVMTTPEQMISQRIDA